MALMKRILCCCVGHTDVAKVNMLPKEKALKKAVKAEQAKAAKAKDASNKTINGKQQDRDGKEKDDATLSEVPPDVVSSHANQSRNGEVSKDLGTTNNANGEGEENGQKTVRVEIIIPPSPISPTREQAPTNRNADEYLVQEKTASFLRLDINPTASNDSQQSLDQGAGFDVAGKKSKRGSGRSLYVLKKKTPETEVSLPPGEGATGISATSSANVDKVLLLQSKGPDDDSDSASGSD